MITREEANEIARMSGLPETAATLFAQFAPEGDRMEITVFTISGRPLGISDVLAGLAHFQQGMIADKLKGELQAPWSGRDERPRPPPAQAPGTYWGG